LGQNRGRGQKFDICASLAVNLREMLRKNVKLFHAMRHFRSGGGQGGKFGENSSMS
jgi:hypothetical protein